MRLCRVPALFAALAALTWAAGPRAAMDEAEKARRAVVAVRVGDQVVTVGELEDRLAGVPRFQLLTFGSDAASVRRKFVDDVLVPEVLVARGAEDRGLAKEPPTLQQVQRALSQMSVRAERHKLGRPSDIGMDEVSRYYEANRSRFDTPARVQLWRILCRSREEATAVLEAAKKEPTVANFTNLAREHSLDKATGMRGGNLGFLGPDGASNEAGLKADPVLVKAAQGVKDGELVPTPIGEGPYFAVVWRRGSVAALVRTPVEVADQIRDTIWKQKGEQAQKTLVDDLRARELKDYNPDLVNAIEISPVDGDVVARKRPGQVPPLGAIGTGRPPAAPTPPSPPGSFPPPLRPR